MSGPAASDRILARLRSETAAPHARLEALVGLASDGADRTPEATRQAYVRYLERVGGFHLALEERLAEHDALEALAELSLRRRAVRAQADLSALGETAVLSRPAHLPELPTAAHALGALYVLEGSTLGAQVLRRHLVAELGERVAGAVGYLDAYGARTGEMWRRLRLALVSFAARGPADEDAIVAGALDTFTALERSFGAAEREDMRMGAWG